MKISELNKKERELKNTIENLKREYRKNLISKRDYDKSVKQQEKELQRLEEEKSSLIGKLPPIPPAPIRVEQTEKKEKREKAVKKAKERAVKAKPARPAELKAVKKEIIDVKRGVDEKIDGDIRPIKKVLKDTQKEFSGFLVDLKKNRDRIEKLESMAPEVNELRKKFNSMDFKGLTDEIYRQFERMNGIVKENEDKIEGMVGQNDMRIKDLEKMMGKISDALGKISVLDEVRRDSEALRQKVEWIEKRLDEMDMSPVMEMVSNVEQKIDRLRMNSPYIIE